MSVVYTPTPKRNTTFTKPADGDFPDAASVDVFLEGLADDAAFRAAGGESVAANWFAGGGLVFNSTKFSLGATDQVWAAVSQGGNDQLEISTDWGKAWANFSGSLGAVKTLVDVAIDTTGNVVIITSTRDVYKMTRSAYATWGAAALSVNALTAAPAGGALDWLEVNTKFVACYRSAGIKIDTSSDGTTWAAATAPSATWSGYAGTNNPELGVNSAGKAIALFANPGGSASIEIAYTSTGTTWTAVTKVSTLLSAAEMTAGARLTRPTYDPISGAWFFVLSATTVDKSEVWKSTDDGATWTAIATFTSKDLQFHSLAVLGGELVGVTSKGRIVASVDVGVTWRWVTGLGGSAGVSRIRAAGGGALVLNSTDKTTRFTPRVGVTLGKVI